MPQKVLLIDDAKMIHTLVRARLVGEAIELHSSYSGEEGLKVADSLLPDLILLDVEMPHPDGFEVCRRLKAAPQTMDIPIVFLTGASTTREKIRGLELGAVDYVTKPFDPAELRVRVRGALRTKYLLDLLSKKARIDGLTALWNRAYFDERLIQETSLSLRTHRPLSCVMLDVDHFKSINDTYGHTFGDEVLKRIAQCLTEVARVEDIVCRWGGEEFAILCPSTDVAGAKSLADRMRQLIIAQEITHHSGIVKVTASFGVAEAANAPSSLLESTDRALYTAKHGGRDRVVVASSLPLPLAG
jgi:diguanylate cyclase (GGDEF)-like protein